jgi:hypothetical protein
MTSLLCAVPPNTPRLPSVWSEPEVVCDSIVADGVELRRAGLASTGPSGEEVTGSAAEAGSSPVARGYFELLERASTLEFLKDRRSNYELRTSDGRRAGFAEANDVLPESDDPARWRYARSNGVALHADWASACDRALWELAERDRLLRAWYGEICPERLAASANGSPLEGTSSYEWIACAFPEPDGATWSRGIHVTGVFGFPLRSEAPFVVGYGARPDRDAALHAAVGEATQLLAFLWGEEIPDAAPELGPTPMHHLERLLFRERHETLRRWLDGDHLRFGGGSGQRRVSPAPTAYLDLTPPWMGDGFHVAKAIQPSAMPLSFGDAPFGAHLPHELRGHPIP